MKPRILIIAELGINHNGDLETAEELVQAAKDAGADVAKFHAYKAEEVMTETTPLAAYMQTGGGSAGAAPKNFLELARKMELDRDTIRHLKTFTEQVGLEFLCSPFDVPSVHFLAELAVNRLKIPSGELVNPFLLEAAAQTGLPLIVSTGMATLDEVGWAVDFLRTHDSGPVTLLHCVSQYPAEFRFVNLRAINTVQQAFGLATGYSDHTPGIEGAVAAVALGAVVIEKHITLDPNLPGPDQKASLPPRQFAAMVKAIRNVEAALGDGVKQPCSPELTNRKIVRKSLVLRSRQPKGTVLAARMLTAKRPGTGIPPIRLGEILGRRLRRDVVRNVVLCESDLE